MSVWDIYFIDQSNLLGGNKWCSVESEIYNSLAGANSFWGNIFELIGYFYKEGKFPILDKKYIYAELIHKKYFRDTEKEKITKSAFYNVLLEELKIFESRFQFYLENELNGNVYYYNKQRILIN